MSDKIISELLDHLKEVTDLLEAWWECAGKPVHTTEIAIREARRVIVLAEEEYPPKKVYVVAWEYDGGGGFNCFLEKAHADIAFHHEKHNAEKFIKENWTAYRFSTKVRSLESAFQKIDEQLPALLTTAECYPARDLAIEKL